jgi:hypothetical protein
MFREDLDATQRDGTRTAGVVLGVLEVEEGVTQRFFRDAVGGLMIVFSKLPHSPAIAHLGPRGQASELKVLAHALAPWGHGYTSWTCGLMGCEGQEV